MSFSPGNITNGNVTHPIKIVPISFNVDRSRNDRHLDHGREITIQSSFTVSTRFEMIKRKEEETRSAVKWHPLPVQ